MSTNGNENHNNSKENDDSRLSKFATCIRDVSATTPFKKKYMYNDPGFQVNDEMRQTFSTMSSKFTQLLKTIRETDEQDMKEHGTMFKHFIFTDLRKAAYGAKSIASFLQMNGYEHIFKSERVTRRRKQKDGTYITVPVKKLKIRLLDLEPVAGGSSRVGILQSSPMWKSQLGIDVRKEMLRVFNSRPDNVHGEKIRFIVLDSKFKEGIDLYDIKYVHIMEPQITEADLKQAVGRATRYCGQRGLNFIPNVGWPLHVSIYETLFAKSFPFPDTDTNYSIEAIDTLFDSHKYMMAQSGIDLGLLEMTRHLTLLSIRSAVDYDLTYKINNFKIQADIHNLTDLNDAVIIEIKTGGAMRAYPKLENINMRKCMKRANKYFPFTTAEIRKTMKAAEVKVPASADRKWFCENMTEDLVVRMLEQAKARTAAFAAASALPAATILEDMENAPASPVEFNSPSSVRAVSPRSPVQELFPVPPRKKLSAKLVEEMPSLADFFEAHEARAAMEKSTNLSFDEFQTYVRTVYEKYGWESPVVKSGCDSVLPQGKAVEFSKTQDFVRHYLTPESPFKGLLAWHSVGTGKTCTAIAAASTLFEKQGYSILWVTKNSLMADVWKNMFGSVCSIPVQEALEAGKKLPKSLGAQKRLISKLWFDPISYRTLQNALVPIKKGKRKGQITKLGKLLRERNSQSDPLRKTFLIIDEVHKLLDGDLKPSEMADFKEIARYIRNSYKVSGQNSVRLLMMTATPITDSPEGLFKLLNLLMPDSKNQLPTVDDFRKEFTNENGKITEEGIEFFQEKTKGLISYLNREFDPTAFAQPVFRTFLIPAYGSLLYTDEEIINNCLDEEHWEETEIDCDVGMIHDELEEELKKVDSDEELDKKKKLERKKTLKAEYKHRSDECKERTKTRKNKFKDILGKVTQCVGNAAKLRKKVYSSSQQKTAKRCFGKNPHGATRKFSDVGQLKKMAKFGRTKPGVQTNIRNYLEKKQEAKEEAKKEKDATKAAETANKNNE
jgi:hypothetical protein